MAEHAPTSVQTILVADDDPDLVALVGRRLTNAGYHIVTAADGEQALALADECLPDLAVLDVMMPRMSGNEVMGRLRASPRTRHIPVILISAGFNADLFDGDPTEVADDYVKKPFGSKELPDRVRAVLDR